MYRRTVRLGANATAGLETARTVLLGHGFRIDASDAAHLRATSPGLYGTRQPPLQGASQVRMEVSGEQLHVEASFRGALLLALFALLFPPALVLGITLTVPGASNPWALLAPWAVISPLMAAWVWYRTRAAVSRLVDNVVTASGAS